MSRNGGAHGLAGWTASPVSPAGVRHKQGVCGPRRRPCAVSLTLVDGEHFRAVISELARNRGTSRDSDASRAAAGSSSSVSPDFQRGYCVVSSTAEAARATSVSTAMCARQVCGRRLRLWLWLREGEGEGEGEGDEGRGCSVGLPAVVARGGRLW